jgi:hypothetical protein
VGGRSFGCGSPSVSGYAIEQEMCVRGAQEWGRGWEGKESADSPGALDSSGNGRWYLRALARNFAGLAAQSVVERRGKRRGGGALFVGTGA